MFEFAQPHVVGSDNRNSGEGTPTDIFAYKVSKRSRRRALDSYTDIRMDEVFEAFFGGVC